MKPITQDALRALIAMQVAVLEWDSDETPLQPQARQALDGMREAGNAWERARATMQRITEQKRSKAREK